MKHLLRSSVPLLVVLLILAGAACSRAGGKDLAVPNIKKSGLKPEDILSGDLSRLGTVKWYKVTSGPVDVADVAAFHDEENLYLVFNVEDKTPLKNRGQDPVNHYKEGDCVDLMWGPYRADGGGVREGDLRLLFVPTEPSTAVIYKPVSRGADADFKTTFTSPVRSITMDFVSQVTEPVMVFKPGGRGYIAAIQVPFKLLGFNYSPGAKVVADLGVLSSNPGGMTTERRAYVFNQKANVVMDVPTEAELSPGEWGVFTLE